MHGNVPQMFDYWADPAANLFLLKNSLAYLLFFKKMGQPRPLFRSFSVFSNKHHYNFYNKYIWKKCPSSIRCWDSNPRPSERESLPFTTRPGLLPLAYLLSQSFRPPATPRRPPPPIPRIATPLALISRPQTSPPIPIPGTKHQQHQSHQPVPIQRH